MGFFSIKISRNSFFFGLNAFFLDQNQSEFSFLGLEKLLGQNKVKKNCPTD